MIKLKELQIELAGICNATCRYCTWQKRPTGKQLMETDLAMRLMHEAKDMGVELVRYHGIGESTMHPDIVDIIKEGDRLGLNNSLSTNCFTLKPQMADELREIESLELILAIPWVMHKNFVDRCIKNAKYFLTKKPKNRVIYVQIVSHESAVDDIKRCCDIFQPLVSKFHNAHIHLKQPVTWPDDEPQHGVSMEVLQAHVGKNVNLSNFPTPRSIGRGCIQPERFIMIGADGSCNPCCISIADWGLGNIKDRSLKELWESDDMKIMRQKWYDSDDSIPCGNCKKRTDC